MNKIVLFFLFFSFFLNAQEENHINTLFTIIDARKAVEDITLKTKINFREKLISKKVDSLNLHSFIYETFKVFEDEFYINLKKNYIKKFKPKKVEKLILQMDKYKSKKEFLEKIQFFKELKKAAEIPAKKAIINLQNELLRLKIDEKEIFKIQN